jgi:hypothetical protein
MSDQLSLFAAPLPVLPPHLTEQNRKSPPIPEDREYLALLPPRPVAWQRLLDRAPPHPVELLVTTLWTGVVVETLSDPAGRHHLWRTGEIVEYPADSAFKRVVYFSPETLAALGRRAPLVILWPGGRSGFAARFVQPGETAAPELDAMLSALTRETAHV